MTESGERVRACVNAKISSRLCGRSKEGGVDLSRVGLAISYDSYACNANATFERLTFITSARAAIGGWRGGGGETAHNGKRGAKLRAQVARYRCVRVAGRPAVVSPGRARERERGSETESGVTRWGDRAWQ